MNKIYNIFEYLAFFFGAFAFEMLGVFTILQGDLSGYIIGIFSINVSAMLLTAIFLSAMEGEDKLEMEKNNGF